MPSSLNSRAMALLLSVGTATSTHAQWIPNYQVYSIQRIGFYGPEHTAINGLQVSTPLRYSASGRVAGLSRRYLAPTLDYGLDAWVWNGEATLQVGLTGQGYTGSTGRQSSMVEFINDAGHAAGYSELYSGSSSTPNGRDAWVWDGTTTARIGLTGTTYTRTSGGRFSTPLFQNSTGQVVGLSDPYSSGGALNGRHMWVWNGTTTARVGFVGGVYTGSAGREYSDVTHQNNSGQVVGWSSRYTGVSSSLGRDSWVWNAGVSTQIGLTGGAYTGTSGTQYSQPVAQNAFGQVLGYSTRYSGAMTSNGQDAWIWNGGATTQIGLTGVDYTGNAGFRSSEPLFLNQGGFGVGYSSRFSAGGLSMGRDSWIWNGSTTAPIGLTGGANARTDGYRVSTVRFLNATGQVSGYSDRYDTANGFNGRLAWVWTGSTTIRVGLDGAVYTGSAGYQNSVPVFQTDSGYVVGETNRFTGVNTDIGQDTWIWDGTMTRQIGLTGGAYTGSAGLQYSEVIQFRNVGFAAGYSRRYTGVSVDNGRDAWYFDPLTLMVTPVIGSIRLSDNYSYSEPKLLTESGFLLGTYRYFPDGMGSGELRAFIFRPDLGLTDLGNLISDDLQSSDWSRLESPIFSDDLRTIIGVGVTQTSGYFGVFALAVPAPSGLAVLVLAGVATASRRRWGSEKLGSSGS